MCIVPGVHLWRGAGRRWGMEYGGTSLCALWRLEGKREGGREEKSEGNCPPASRHWSTVSYQFLRDSVSFSVLRGGITGTISNSARGQSSFARLDRKRTKVNNNNNKKHPDLPGMRQHSICVHSIHSRHCDTSLVPRLHFPAVYRTM